MSGANRVLARPPARVSTVNAATARGPYQRVKAANAGGYNTALIATPESFAHDYHKQRLVAAKTDDTLLTEDFHINWPPGAKVRVLANSVTRGEQGDPFSA